MGRTIHWDIEGKLSEEEKEKISKISKQFNSGDLEKVWTCDNFYIDFYKFYPNWIHWGKYSSKEVWQKINDHYAKLEKAGWKEKEIVYDLQSRNWVTTEEEENDQVLRSGFCKVGGNEYNAMLVVLALTVISQEADIIIKIRDEGEYLIVPIQICGGLAKVDMEDLYDSWDYWAKEGWLDHRHENYNKHEVAYKRANQEKLSLEAINISWQPVTNFCRKVHPKDFENHPEYQGSQIMAGFDGEYYGLSDKDPEQESYKMLGTVTSMLKKVGWTKDNIVITPKL